MLSLPLCKPGNREGRERRRERGKGKELIFVPPFKSIKPEIIASARDLDGRLFL